VTQAWVEIDGERVAQIGQGLAVLLGVGRNDSENDARYLVDKISGLRIFEDEAGKMNLSVMDIAGEALVVSQFTLMANCRKGRRPGFDGAAPPDEAERLYNRFVDMLKETSIPTQTGRFQADMIYGIINDGPVTIIMDTENL
jgi:D-tyrosyl-tRNA(Tyr) deacylase